MSSDCSVTLVEAVFSFKGKNNDELNVNKGDIIIITQKEEGGWWEGTLNGKTGWFPSNFVKEFKIPDPNQTGVIFEGGQLSPQHNSGDLVGPQLTQQQKIYRNLVLKDIISTEKAHVGELQDVFTNYINPLQKSEILSDSEFKQLVGNFGEVLKVHSSLVTALEEQNERPAREQRIGGAFLLKAPSFQAAHKLYCSTHPRAVCILEKYKEELNTFVECQGAARPGIMVLTTALSKPFRRLDKYSVMLQEYERHLEEAHPDRGDTQRSSHVFRDLASSCGAIRRHKELELEVITGRVHGWEGGETLGALGDVMRMGSVALLPDHRDRYLVLFPATLVMLAVSPRMSAFIFEGNYPLLNINVQKLEDGELYKHAFEVSGSISDKIVAVCQTRDDQQQWVDILNQQIRCIRSSFPQHKSPLTPPPIPPTHIAPLMPRQSSTASISDSPNRSIRPQTGKIWSMSCLRPSPPMRPGLSLREEKRLQRNKRQDNHWNEDDTLILRVIEAYCTSAKTRYTVNSILLDSPQLLIAEDEKIIIEETHGNQVFVEEKSLVDTVYALKDQVASLSKDYQALKKAFEFEKISTHNLKNILRQYALPGRDDIKWDLDI